MTLLDDCLTAPFSQSTPLQNIFPRGHAMRAGVCFALSIEWIARHRSHKGESAVERIAAIGSSAALMKASITQRLYAAEMVRGGWGTLNHHDAQNAAMEHLKMRFKDEKFSEYVNYTSEESVRQILRALNSRAGRSHSYNLVSMEFRQGGAHATCCYKSSGKMIGVGSHLYAFDPNLGEFKVPGGQVKEFYKALFDRYYNNRDSDGDLSRYEVKNVAIDGVA